MNRPPYVYYIGVCGRHVPGCHALFLSREHSNQVNGLIVCISSRVFGILSGWSVWGADVDGLH